MPALVIHIPHASTTIPTEAAETFLLSHEELEVELLRLTDWFTDELFCCRAAPAITIASPVSRLVVDVERFRDDAEEIMASRGMGVIYTRTADGRPLRAPLPVAEREKWLARWYDPPHAALSDAVRHGLDICGKVLIIDGHSFPSSPLPYELDQEPRRPDVCLGADAFHTPPRLYEYVRDYFVGLGLTVEKDRPFSGAIVPQAFHRNEPKVASLMIELNRRLYLDEGTGSRNGCFPELKAGMGALFDGLAGLSWPD